MKKWFSIILIVAVIPFLMSETTDENATILTLKYETLAENFIQFLDDLEASDQAETMAEIINAYVDDNVQLFDEIEALLDPFMDEDSRPSRLKQAMNKVQEALNRMGETVSLLEPYIGNPEVEEAWIGFMNLFGVNNN